MAHGSASRLSRSSRIELERTIMKTKSEVSDRRMVAAVKKLAGDWKYDVVSIG